MTFRSDVCACTLAGIALSLSSTAGAATTFAAASADARGSCSTEETCRALAGTPYPPPVRQENMSPGGDVSGATAAQVSGGANSGGFAQAGVGWLRAGGYANGGGIVFRNTFEPFQSGAGGQAYWTDSLLPTAPGVTGAFFTFDLILDGTLSASRSGDAFSAASNVTVSLKSPATYVPPSLGGVNNLWSLQLSLVERSPVAAGAGNPEGVNLTRMTSETLANAFPTVTTTQVPSDRVVDIDEVLTVTQWFPFGVSTTFEVFMQVGANGLISLPGRPGEDGVGFFGAESEFGSTLRWGGITAIRDARGRDIRGSVSLTSGSGVDYWSAITAPPVPVPLPATGWLLASGVGLLLARAQRKAKARVA